MRCNKAIVSLTLGLMLGSASCGGGEVGVLLNVMGTPPQTDKLLLGVALNDQQGTPSQTAEWPKETTQLGFTFDAKDTGTLKLDLQAVDTDRCLRGQAKQDLPLPVAKGMAVSLTLSPQQPRKCGVLSPCPVNTLCGESIKPTTFAINAFWAVASNDIWAVGESGSVLHWDGVSWSLQRVPTVLALFDVWASGPKDIWAVGEATTQKNAVILHFDGQVWTDVQSPSAYDLNSIYGVSPTQIWAVGENDPVVSTTAGEFVSWDGARWVRLTNPLAGRLVGVWAASANDVYAVGKGLMIRHNGTTFQTVPLAAQGVLTTTTLTDIRGSAANDIWAVGSSGMILRYNGTAWSRLGAGSTGADLYAVYPMGPGLPVFFAGTGTTFLRSEAPYTSVTANQTMSVASGTLLGLGAGTDGIGWVGGAGGFLGHFDTKL